MLAWEQGAFAAFRVNCHESTQPDHRKRELALLENIDPLAPSLCSASHSFPPDYCFSSGSIDSNLAHLCTFNLAGKFCSFSDGPFYFS